MNFKKLLDRWLCHTLCTQIACIFMNLLCVLLPTKQRNIPTNKQLRFSSVQCNDTTVVAHWQCGHIQKRFQLYYLWHVSHEYGEPM